MNEGKYPEEIIRAAVAYGETLNRATYRAAKKEKVDDKKRGYKGPKLEEYKQRNLLQLESIIDSANNNQNLIARLNSQAGRFTPWDVDIAAKPFLQAVMNDKMIFQDAKDIIKAFMRLSTYDPSKAETVD
jgi:hypothetical protein